MATPSIKALIECYEARKETSFIIELVKKVSWIYYNIFSYRYSENIHNRIVVDAQHYGMHAKTMIGI